MTKISGYALLAIAAMCTGTAALAQENCIELKTTAETEQQYVNEQGEKATRLVPLTKALPGDEVVWTVTAKNTCAKSVEKVVVANPVPEHMTYVANSALGVGTAIAYSLDGEQFQPAAALVVNAGAIRAATPEEYRAIRWTYQASFAPGATAFVRYRARVN